MSTPTPHHATAARPARSHPPEYHDIPALKERLLIPEAWQALGLEGRPAARCSSPFRPDKTPSFSIYDGGRRWKDFATGAAGDVIDFIALARQTSPREALRVFLELAGVPVAQAGGRRGGASRAAQPKHHAPFTFLQGAASARPAADPGGVRVPIQRGTAADWRQVAETRLLSQEAVSLALGLRTLTFGLVQGFSCWILTDAEHRIAEARRVDGRPFPAAGTLAARKAHTLRGSSKSWPLGTAVLRRLPDFRTLLLVEGGPDYLAALHFADELGRWDVLPVAMLGRGTGAQMDPAALELMRGRRVRIYPHNDADGGGVHSAHLWGTQLHQAGCEVDFFEFSDLRRSDGTPVKDLNDCTTGLDEASLSKLRQNLLPESCAAF